MANIGDLVVTIDANTSGLESGLTRAQAATNKFAQSAKKSVQTFSKGSQRALQRFSKSASSAASGFSRIARESQTAVPPIGRLNGLLATLTGFLGARQVIGYADAWQSAGNQLRQVTDDASELASIQRQLLDVSNETRADFGATANLFSRLTRSTTELGLSQKDIIGLTRTINQSFATNGATAIEAAGAITQLSQGLAAGALRGDEFNSVSEQAPGIMRAIAESLGMTIGELREFAAEGGITAEIVVEALQDSADAIEDDFSRAVATFGQNMTIARNNLIEFIGNADSVEGAVENLGESVVGLSENLDTMGSVATAVAGVFVGRLVGRFITVAAGMTAAAGAATALRTALAFLGGPAGILVAVAGGLFAFREELGLVPNPAKDAREEVELLSGAIEDLNRSSVQAAMVSINAQLFELEMQARDAREELQELSSRRGSGALGLAGGVTGGQSRAQAELGEIGAQRSALMARMEELQGFLTAADEAAEGADRLGKSTNEAADALEKFSASLSPEVESILERAGPGATIDAEGQIRDAFGNTLPTIQRDLDKEMQNQIRNFSNEQNLQRGLEAAAQKFMDGANSAVRQAFGSITPMSTDAVNDAIGEAKNIGSLTFKLERSDGSTGETNVEGDADDLRRLASLFSGVASAA